MIRLAIIAMLAGLAATPASATEWIDCADDAGAASFNFLVGSGEVLSIAGLTVTAGKQSWASNEAYGPGPTIRIGQAFEDAETIRIDAVADGSTDKLAELRLFKARDATDDPDIYGGTLDIVGRGAWPVTCSGP